MNNVWLMFLSLLILILVSPEGVYTQGETKCKDLLCPDDTNGNPQCCAELGFCGTGSDYCGDGCISGPCLNSTNPTSERCLAGPCNDPTLCCSAYYYCGDSEQHCSSCVPGRGRCDQNGTAPPTNNQGECLGNGSCPVESHCCSKFSYCGDDAEYCGEGCKGGPCIATREIAFSTSLSIGLGVLVGLCTLLAAFAGGVLAMWRDQYARQGPFYCAIVISGVLMSCLSAFVLLAKQTNALCMAFPWFLGIAFNLVYGCLFIKTWVIYGMFRRAAQMKRVTVDPYFICKLLALFLGIEVIFLIVWTIVDPLKTHFTVTNGGDNAPIEIQCKNHGNIFWIIFLSYKVLWLLFGGILSFLMRKASKEYNKSKAIAYSIYNNVVIILLAVPLVVVLEKTQYATVIVKVVSILLSFTFTLFILNFSVWHKIFYARFDVVAALAKVQAEATHTNTTMPTSDSSSSFLSQREGNIGFSMSNESSSSLPVQSPLTSSSSLT